MKDAVYDIVRFSKHLPLWSISMVICSCTYSDTQASIELAIPPYIFWDSPHGFWICDYGFSQATII